MRTVVDPPRERKRLPKVLTENQFWDRMDPEPNTGCWIWLGSATPNGYGKVKWLGKHVSSHRLAFRLAGGVLIPGLVIDHWCRNTLCGNPRHLRQVTQRENVFRTEAVSAVNARKDHCKYGHAFAGDNLRILRNGDRSCKACARRLGRIHDAKRGWRRGKQCATA